MTRALMLSTLLVACACSHAPVRSGSPTSTSEDIRSLLTLEEELFRAIQARDRAALAELLAEDFVFRGPGDVELGRAAFLDTLTSLPGTLVSVEGTQVKAHTFGETGVLTGVQHARVRMQDGAEVTDSQAFSDVCVRREGRWRVVLAHSVPSAPEVKP